MAHRSWPEYEQLKDLLQRGKSATMLPSITASSSGHWNHEGSRKWQRSTLPSCAKLDPCQNIAAKALNQRDAFACVDLESRRQGSSDWTGGQLPQNLIDDRHALLDLAHADPEAGIHVTVFQHRHFELQRVVRGIARRPSRIERPSRSPPDVASSPELSRERRFKDARPDGAVLQRRRVVIEFDKLWKVRSNVSDEGCDRIQLVLRQVANYPAGRDAIHHEPMTEALVRHSEHILAQKAELGVQHGERSIVAYGTEIAEVICQSFQFGHERP